MTDSSSDEEHEMVDDRPQIGHSRFSSFTKQFPAKFKKVVSRERVSSAHDVHDAKAPTSSSSNSYLSRFIPSRMRSPSQENGTASPSPHLSHAQHSAHHSAHHHSAHSQHSQHQPTHRRDRRRQSSPTPPSQHSHSSPSSEQQPSHHSHSHTHSPSAHHQRAFEVILGENRLLKNEVAMYKRSLSAATAEKDELLESYEALKSKVSDVTTQLRIMSRRYQKLRAKNDEYKKHLQNTLSARWQSQQDTIAQYHRQLSSIKAKYDILYAQYLEKNQLIAAWKHKHDRLAMDFDEFANDASAANDGSRAPSRLTASQLVRQCKDKEANLEALARIIRRMYAAAVPIIGEGSLRDDDDDELEDELGHLNGERESEEDEEEDEQEALSVDDDDDDALELDHRDHRDHRGQGGAVSASTSTRDLASLGVELATSTPPNSAMEFDEDDEDDDEAAESETSSEAPMTSRRAHINGDARRSHSAAQSKQLEQLQRFLIHHSNGNGNGHGKAGTSQAQSRSESIRSYATSHNLSAPPSKHSASQRSNGRRLSQRTLSEESMRSINDDGIDERDDEPLPKPAAASTTTATVMGAMSSIVLPKAMPTLSGKTSSGSNRSAKMVSSPTASSCSAGSNKPKKRRRSWTTNGQIIVTTMPNGQHSVSHAQPQTQSQQSQSGKGAKAKNASAKEKEKNASSSASESMEVAPSPAPPPPHPYILQTPQLSPQRAEREEQLQHENREIVVSDQLSTPSPNPTAHKFVKKRLGHYGHDDDEEDEDEQCTISE